MSSLPGVPPATVGPRNGGPADHDDRGVDELRRRVVGAAAIGALTLAPGVSLIAYPEAREEKVPAGASPKKRWGLLIDTNKCKPSCNACVTACSAHNGWENEGRGSDPQWIRKVEVTDPKTRVSRSAPVMCQHCSNAPCVEVCPTGASFKRADGIVLVDKHICIGCRMCVIACPFEARFLVSRNLAGQKAHVPRGKGTAEGCTLCVDLVDAGKVPACVEACAREGSGAMMFGDLMDPASDISRALAAYPATQLRADLMLDAGVFYQGL